MAWGTITVGGLVFRETQQLTDGGGNVSIGGQDSTPPQTITEVRSRHLNVLGLLDSIVPVLFTDKSVEDGFYLVSDASSDLSDYHNGAQVTATWSMSLQRIGRDADVELESRVPTIARATELAGQTPSFWHAVPPATRDYYTGATVPSATTTRTSAEGVITVYRGIPASVAPRWTCPAGGYMAGAPRILLDSVRRAGVDTPNAVSTFEMSNGLVRVTGGGGPSITVSVWDPDISNWATSAGYTPTVAGAALTATPEVTILRNDPEETTIRLSYPTAPGRTTVDLGLRRGARFVTGVMKRHSAATLGVTRTAAEAATAVTGGLRATSADANGNRNVMGSSRTITTTTATPSIAKASVTSFDFFLGHELGATPVAGDAFADLLVQYLGTSGDRTRVIRR